MIDTVGRIFEQEIDHGVIHGATVLAGGLDGEEVRASWGLADEAHSRPMTPTTVIDVASVTKAAAGVTAFLVAHRKGLVDFDAPLADVLPTFSAPLSRRLTIRDLANHVSGYGEADVGGGNRHVQCGAVFHGGGLGEADARLSAGGSLRRRHSTFRPGGNGRNRAFENLPHRRRAIIWLAICRRVFA